MAKGTTMIVNPFLDVRPVREEGVVRAIRVHAPVKGEGLKVTTIDRDHDPEFFGLMLINFYLAMKGALMADSITERERERLTAIGLLVPDDIVPNPVHYLCDFDDVPTKLLPLRAQRLRPPTWCNDLIVDPTFHHLGQNAIMPEMRQYKLVNPFREDRSWFSIEDGLSAPVFYSYKPGIGASVDLLSSGQPVPKDFSCDVRQKLIEAGVLRLRVEASARREIRERERVVAHRTLMETRYIVLQEIIRPFQLAAIRRYYRDLIDEGFVRFGDPEWPDRFFSARDSLAYFFQQQLTAIISDIVGEKVKPTFSFLASYRPGSELKPHHDRAQCRYAMSVLLDHNQADDVSSWPIYMQPPGAPQAIPVSVGLGDGLLYFGEEVLHYRHRLEDGYATLWFLFWVPESFEGSLD
jgi:hypothetical protein